MISKMGIIRHPWLLAIFAAMCSVQVTASADTLAGVVVSSDDRPVSGALVAVTDNATGMIIVETLKRGQGPHFTSTLTDSAGRFTLDVPPGNYNILAQQWACLPLNDAIKQDETRVALRSGDLKTAGKHGQVYHLTPLIASLMGNCRFLLTVDQRA